jgi:hypothetical protein
MSRSIRFAAALLILASLTCGSLSALPSSSRTIPADSGRGDFLSAVVEWITSLLRPDRPVGKGLPPPQQPQGKEGSGYDPNGGGH